MPIQYVSHVAGERICPHHDHIVIKDHVGTWYVIDVRWVPYQKDMRPLFLLENEIFGDEAAYIIADEWGHVILDGVYNGWLDYEEFISLPKQG